MGAVLLIEDEAPTAKMYKRVLERSGYEVVTAGNGQEGLKELARMNGHTSVILLDIMMPVMGGVEFLERMRARGYDTPVIVITSVDPKELQGLDVFEVFPKPIPHEKLVELVSGCEHLYRRLGEEVDSTIDFIKGMTDEQTKHRAGV